MIARGLVLALALVALAPAARADAGLVDQARQHYEHGRAHYEAARYREAIVEFKAGFELAPRPLFLLNLGQAYRMAGEPRSAREQYEKFLAASPLDDPDRGDVTRLCARLEEEIARLPPEPPPPPPSVMVAVAVAPAAHRPFIRRHWWIIPVSVVVTASALGLGLYFGLRGHEDACASYSFGCGSIVK